MKFTLTNESTNGSKVTHEFKSDFLSEVVSKVDLFLKVGFQVEEESKEIYGRTCCDKYGCVKNAN
jgi:hypothetical protein